MRKKSYISFMTKGPNEYPKALNSIVIKESVPFIFCMFSLWCINLKRKHQSADFRCRACNPCAQIRSKNSFHLMVFFIWFMLRSRSCKYIFITLTYQSVFNTQVPFSSTCHLWPHSTLCHLFFYCVLLLILILYFLWQIFLYLLVV